MTVYGLAIFQYAARATFAPETETPTTPECEGDKEWSQCMPCPRTCNDTEVCIEMCRPGCACPSVAPIDLGNNTCGTLQDCSPEQCPSNQVFSDCGGCPITCSNPTVICPMICLPGCTCPPELPILLENGTCATLADCPGKTCPYNQVFNQCGSPCPRTCSNPNPPCIKMCEAKCECPPSTPILLDNGTCITLDECSSALACPSNQIHVECVPGCPQTCRNPDIICPTFACREGCACPPELPLRLANGTCISQSQCGQVLPCSSIRVASRCHATRGDCRWSDGKCIASF